MWQLHIIFILGNSLALGPGILKFAQAFLSDILEDDDFLEKRRKLLRLRRGLTDKDRKKVRFSDVCSSSWVKVQKMTDIT